MLNKILPLTIASLSLSTVVNVAVSAANLTFPKTTSVKVPLQEKQDLFLADVVASNSLISNFVLAQQPQVITNPVEIARQITVRISTNPGIGSGIIVDRKGENYTVLTNNHVVADSWDNQYTVLTADGITHPAYLVKFPQFANLDLAMVQFSSRNNYQVVVIGNVDYSSFGETVYAAGFPNWYWVNSNTPISTREWGLKALKITTGTIEMLPSISLSKGYQLGYTNDIRNGMSGGPVLDAKGRLIGINGRLKHPFIGIDAYFFTDGSQPSPEEFLRMEALSWAIPITTVQQFNLFSNN